MYTIHACWKPTDTGNLYLWGESHTAYERHATASDGIHPFAAQYSELEQLLRGCALSTTLSEEELLLSLPSSAMLPIPSFDRSQEAERFHRWSLPALSIASRDALELLTASVTTHDLTFGPSWHYYQRLATFAAELIYTGAFLPVLSSSYEASWKPFLTQSNMLKLQQFAQHVPFCEEGAEALVHDFLNKTIDAFIKTSGVSPITRKPQTIVERWLHQLHTLDGTTLEVTNDSQEIVQTTEQFFAMPSSVKLFTLGFRLAEPVHAHQSWTLEFYLQSEELRFSATDIWNQSPRSSEYECPQERLLKDLIRASYTYQKIGQAFSQKQPISLSLTLAEASSFLQTEGELLVKAGFLVEVPAWYKHKKKLTSRVKISNRSSELLSMDSILDYEWQLSIDDTSVTEKDLEKLVQLKLPLVHLNGQWVRLESTDLEALQLFKNKGSTIPFSDALKLALVDEQTIDTEGFLAEFLTKLRNPFEDTSRAPATFQGTLRPYQLRGLSWLSFLSQTGCGMCLADDMGLGKTIQIIALLLQKSCKPTLIVCPLSIVTNWQKELTRFAPGLSVYIHHGAQRLDKEAFIRAAHSHDIVLTTYAIVGRDSEKFHALNWHMLIIDEAQTIKNSTTKQTQAIKKIPARSKIALTGTPIENRLSELWSLMDFLNKGYLGSLRTFTQTFIQPIERDGDTKRSEQLKRLISPFVLRRVKTDKTIIQDLPDKIETKELCYLTKEQTSLYQALVTLMLNAVEKAEGIERKGLVLTTLLRLKQICNHPVNFLKDRSSLSGRSGKLVRLEELLEEILAEGGKSLIFTQFAQMGGLLQTHLETRFQQPVLFLHGKSTKKERDKIVEAFQSPDGPSLFILSLKAGGIGLNLTEANHVFHFDRWWNPAVETQATDRAFRIGQKRVVQVHTLITAGTVEERIDELIERKKQLADLVISPGEQWISELSTEDLRELFTLDPHV